MRLAPKVAILIINYNGLAWLPRCLSTVAKTKYPNYEVYVIDNASVDGSVEFVHRKFPTVKIIKNSRNLGLPEAYNRAIAQVDAEYVAMLNNDTEVLNARWIEDLVRVASENPTVAAVTSKMVSMNDHQILQSVGGMGIPYWRGFVDIGASELDKNQYRDEFEPFAFCGGAALIRKSAFVDVGRYDGEMFLYLEDTDLSWRLRLAGWKVEYAPASKVAHYLGGSTEGGGVTPLRLYYCHRNLLRAIVKNCGSSLGWALRNYFLFSLLIMSGFFIYEPNKAIVILRAIAWNIRNLRTAYASRLRVQSRRKVSEQEILRRMYPALRRKQAAEYASLRRILNVLFEYSDRRRFQAAIQTQTSRKH
jgi:GT2 family glycosyltransferase